METLRKLRRWKKKKEYLRKTRNLLKTKLHSRNLVKGIKTWAVPLGRYSRSFLKWTREELQQIDQRTRKFMTKFKALQPLDDMDRLYVSKKGGRRLICIHGSIDASIHLLEDCIKKCRGRLITAIRNNRNNTSINRTKATRKQKWEEKQLYGYFKRQTNEISNQKT